MDEKLETMKSDRQLAVFLRRALRDDPVCICGGRLHQHSDDGPCYHCANCDVFEERENEDE